MDRKQTNLQYNILTVIGYTYKYVAKLITKIVNIVNSFKEDLQPLIYNTGGRSKYLSACFLHGTAKCPFSGMLFGCTWIIPIVLKAQCMSMD